MMNNTFSRSAASTVDRRADTKNTTTVATTKRCISGSPGELQQAVDGRSGRGARDRLFIAIAGVVGCGGERRNVARSVFRCAGQHVGRRFARYGLVRAEPPLVVEIHQLRGEY